MINMQPRNGLVVIKIHDKKQETVGNIAIPASQQKLYDYATVLAVGRGSTRLEVDGGTYVGCEDLKVGDIVLVKTHAFRPGPHGQTVYPITVGFLFNGETVTLVNETDIVAIITKETE